MNIDPCSEVFLCQECGYPTERDMPVCQTCLWDTRKTEPTPLTWSVLLVWVLAFGVGLSIVMELIWTAKMNWLTRLR